MLLKNKTAIITGSNKGIGKAILKVFSQNGANIISCVRKKTEEFEDSISKIEKKYNNKVTIKEVDFIDEEIAKKVGTEISFENKKIDILVNNAGIIETSLFQMTSIKRFKEIFQVNYFSQITFSQQII